mmetsp:Transcript_6734/g.5995  ORF Transcript_6734/g.5995 Transcript_6734/m.5995 type:complete len:83 (+) Transcript_6734:1-249(+)
MKSNYSSVDLSPKVNDECSLGEFNQYTPHRLLSAKKELSFRCNSTASKKTAWREKMQSIQRNRKDFEENIRRRIDECKEIVK